MRLKASFLHKGCFQQLEMVPVSHRNAEIDIESPASRRPAKNMAKHYFPCRGSREKVCRFVPARNLVDFPDRFENDWIDLVMLDF
jgi:hypothetical protein